MVSKCARGSFLFFFFLSPFLKKGVFVLPGCYIICVTDVNASSGLCVPQFLRKSLKFKVKNADLNDGNSETQDLFLGHLSLL